MTHSVHTEWKGNMLFDAEISGHHLLFDAMPESGGENKGPRPKELMLAALAGCTGMDVVAILKKMRVSLGGFSVRVVSELTEEHPKHYKSMHIEYVFSGKELPADKLEQAVQLSQEKYCGVSHMYKKAMPLTYEIKINSI
ncbi:MAG: OsmC family protein [Bacteroidota bacterium]